jgi:hypothetical protein
MLPCCQVWHSQQAPANLQQLMLGHWCHQHAAHAPAATALAAYRGFWAQGSHQQRLSNSEGLAMAVAVGQRACLHARLQLLAYSGVAGGAALAAAAASCRRMAACVKQGVFSHMPAAAHLGDLLLQGYRCQCHSQAAHLTLLVPPDPACVPPLDTCMCPTWCLLYCRMTPCWPPPCMHTN